MRKKLLVVVMLWAQAALVGAQDYPLTDSLRRNLEQSKTTAEKILWLGELAEFYIAINRTYSDEFGARQLELAELSRDRHLMLQALLSNASRHFNIGGGIQENINKARGYSQRALDLAKANGLDDYTARAYLSLARAARNNGDTEQSLNYNNLALSLSATIDNDSLKISCLNSLGNTYQDKREMLLAFRNYLQAMNLAERVDNYRQRCASYYNLAAFYRDLGEYEKAKDYLFKVCALTITNNKPYDRLEAYRNIGRVYSASKQYEIATEFYEKVMALADTVKLEIYKLNSYGHIIDQYFASNQAAKGLQYFKDKPELRNFMKKVGADYFIYQAYAVGYMETGRYDSAAYFFKLAEPEFETKTSKHFRHRFYLNYAAFYELQQQYPQALTYLLKAKASSDELEDLELKKNTAQKLDELYRKLGDFKSAYAYNQTYNTLGDSLQKLATEKDLMLLEVDNENRRKEREAQVQEQARRDRHNLQYLGITAAIAAVFIALVMLGIFSVSQATIKIIGFFAFIFLFEFIILLADNQIHHWTHGEPWKILAIKIGLISVLLPLHHFLEEKVIHYLTSRKLMSDKNNLFAKIRRKKPEEAVDTGSGS